MKKALFLILVLSLAAFAQDKPLTQTEYVKMLYALQKNPAGKSDIVDAVRKRGIDFVLTDGLRSLTRSKGGNDDELKRALEEADRRRQNPESAKMPSEKEAADVLEKARKANLAALNDMPDFVVKQIIARSWSPYAGTGNWKPLDVVIIAVSFSTEKGEQYKVLAINGAPVDAEGGNNYDLLSGTTTSGEFVDDLARIFKPESRTDFKLLTTDVIRNQASLVFDFEILTKNSKTGVGLKSPSATGKYTFTTVPAGEKGKVWISRNNGRILRIEYAATDIPRDFSIKAVESSIDYDWVEIAGEKYLLPTLSETRFTAADGGQLSQNKNVIRFKNYQKYGTDVKVIEEDNAPIPEEKPNQ